MWHWCHHAHWSKHVWPLNYWRTHYTTFAHVWLLWELHKNLISYKPGNGTWIWPFPNNRNKESYSFATRPLASRYQEELYKLLTQHWYRMLIVLLRMFHQVLNTCCHCLESEETFLHIFVECSKFKDFWSMVEQTIKTTTDVPLEGNPASFLLYDTLLYNKMYTNSLLKHLFTAAKACIPALYLLTKRVGLPGLQKFNKWRTWPWSWRSNSLLLL